MSTLKYAPYPSDGPRHMVGVSERIRVTVTNTFGRSPSRVSSLIVSAQGSFPMNEFLQFLGTIGGVSVILLGLSAWLGRVWAERISEQERSRNAQELERLKLELDLVRTQALRVSQAKFELYSAVWSDLQDVRTLGDRLWQRPTRNMLQQFIDALHAATAAINRGRLLLRESDYGELQRLIEDFENYRVGKQRLIEIASPDELETNFNLENGADVQRQIEQNGVRRKEYEKALEAVASHFRQELRITA